MRLRRSRRLLRSMYGRHGSTWAAGARPSTSSPLDSTEDFRPGGTIVSKAKGLPRTTLTITRVEPPHVWVDASRSPGVQMTFEHVIEPGEAGTELTERVLIGGPLARLV